MAVRGVPVSARAGTSERLGAMAGDAAGDGARDAHLASLPPHVLARVLLACGEGGPDARGARLCARDALRAAAAVRCASRACRAAAGAADVWQALYAARWEPSVFDDAWRAADAAADAQASPLGDVDVAAKEKMGAFHRVAVARERLLRTLARLAAAARRHARGDAGAAANDAQADVDANADAEGDAKALAASPATMRAVVDVLRACARRRAPRTARALLGAGALRFLAAAAAELPPGAEAGAERQPLLLCDAALDALGALATAAPRLLRAVADADANANAGCGGGLWAVAAGLEAHLRACRGSDARRAARVGAALAAVALAASGYAGRKGGALPPASFHPGVAAGGRPPHRRGRRAVERLAPAAPERISGEGARVRRLAALGTHFCARACPTRVCASLRVCVRARVACCVCVCDVVCIQ